MTSFALDPTRLHFFLTVALHNAALPYALAQAVFAQAWHQYWVRAPAAQLVVHGTGGETSVVTVGRQ
mgnify:CR=1 FL=1